MERVDVSLYLLGYQRAAGRFLGGGDRLRDLVNREVQHLHDPSVPSPFDDHISASGVLIALLEALNWAVSLDDRIRRDWPHPKPRHWYRDIPDGHLVRGLRYARNAVHHDWALAIDLEDGADPHRRFYTYAWKWVDKLPPDKPDPEGEDAFNQHIAGTSTMLTLGRLGAVFASGMTELAAHGRMTGKSPEFGAAAA